MSYAHLRFDEMVRELKENNRLLGKLVEFTEKFDRNLQIEIPPLWPSEQGAPNRQKTANTENGKDEKSS